MIKCFLKFNHSGTCTNGYKMTIKQIFLLSPFRKFFCALLMVCAFVSVIPKMKLSLGMMAQIHSLNHSPWKWGLSEKACKENIRIRVSNDRQAGFINLKINPGFQPSLKKKDLHLKGNGEHA